MESLTGRRRYRIGWMGSVILQVEVSGVYSSPDPLDFYQSPYTKWRDATVEDLTVIPREAA